MKFPNTEKVVIDCRGLGDAFPVFLSQPWTDPETNKEYPPLVPDNEHSLIHNAVPLLRPVIANNTINHQMVNITTVALEQQSLELPISSRFILDNKITMDDDDDKEDGPKKLTTPEKAIFVEADALQVEMGNIVSKPTSAGSVVYDVAKATQHKDRYSALGMALLYVNELEDMRKKLIYQNQSNVVVGVVSRF